MGSRSRKALGGSSAEFQSASGHVAVTLQLGLISTRLPWGTLLGLYVSLKAVLLYLVQLQRQPVGVTKKREAPPRKLIDAHWLTHHLVRP